jgi:nitroimidazol reductase NimA-like FMN-containing flavoprotein (pyridoxamine 5'-phosphate oxidase superfamily)
MLSRLSAKIYPRLVSVFTDLEIDYFRSRRLGRLATVGPDSQPHVVPVGFRYKPEPTRSFMPLQDPAEESVPMPTS